MPDIPSVESFVRSQLLLRVVRSDYFPRIQEVQASIDHVLRLALDRLT